MEYYFQNQLGLLAILPQPELPSAVQLQVAGAGCGIFISAEDAAAAVASRISGHAGLDALPAEVIPANLKDWQPSLPLRFTTGKSGEESLAVSSGDQTDGECLHIETQLAF